MLECGRPLLWRHQLLGVDRQLGKKTMSTHTDTHQIAPLAAAKSRPGQEPTTSPVRWDVGLLVSVSFLLLWSIGIPLVALGPILLGAGLSFHRRDRSAAIIYIAGAMALVTFLFMMGMVGGYSLQSVEM